MTCLDFIEDHSDPQRQLMLVLHELISSFPGVTPKLRFQLPFYDRNRWLCYLKPWPDGGVALDFCQANLLSNQQGLLVFGKRTQVASLIFQQISDIPTAALLEILQEALLVDEQLGRPARRKK